MFEVTLIAETSFGCTVSVSDTVEIVENEIGGEIISLGQTCDASVILGFDQETGGTIVDYHWMPTNDTTSTINAMQADMFTLQVWDENGCTFITDPFMVSIVEPFDFHVCLWRHRNVKEQERTNWMNVSIQNIRQCGMRYQITQIHYHFLYQLERQSLVLTLYICWPLILSQRKHVQSIPLYLMLILAIHISSDHFG